ncbi:MAG: hypothetical protein AAFW73_20690 [Bacteroidota bacterium]
MSLALIRLLLDFGLFVLIWLVQLVVYPSFKYYQSADLLRWHGPYTQGISVIVIPLMLAQLFVVLYQCWQAPTAGAIASAALVIALWGITFLQFVPLHDVISRNSFDAQTLHELVAKNWWRTLLWTLLLGVSVAQYLSQVPATE